MVLVIVVIIYYYYYFYYYYYYNCFDIIIFKITIINIVTNII